MPGTEPAILSNLVTSKGKKEEEEEKNPHLNDLCTDMMADQSNIITHIRKKSWEVAKKYEMEAMVQMHSAFYESQREQLHAQRQTSNVIFLRKFNNWIKSVLINNICFQKGKCLSVLDI